MEVISDSLRKQMLVKREENHVAELNIACAIYQSAHTSLIPQAPSCFSTGLQQNDNIQNDVIHCMM